MEIPTIVGETAVRMYPNDDIYCRIMSTVVDFRDSSPL